MMVPKVPQYHELPTDPRGPAGSAWGLFDRDGVRDVYGTLNFITPEIVVAAKAEIQTGESTVLNLPMHLPYHADLVGRQAFEHKIIDKAFGMYCCDDEVKLNTQSSSQWDGLLHYANQARREYYNGVRYADAAELRADVRLGIQALSARGGIVGRGVLLDFVRYAAKQGITHNPFSSYAISLSQLKAMVAEEGLTLRPGDILLVRSGVSKWIRRSKTGDNGPFHAQSHIGVDSCQEVLEWIWNNNLAAVGGDAIAFEAVPAPDNSFLRLHEACLAGWGMMIGELLDLENLAELAEKNKRWSFFLTICPLNIQGGAATTANTLAVF